MVTQMSAFGFSTTTSSGDFLPVVKYDSRAGRMFRLDRVDVGGQWINEQKDITSEFKAQFDFENLETSWINFQAGAAPVFALAKVGDPLPAKPSETARNGIRVLVKLAADIGGDKRVRELAGNAKVFLQG